MSVLIDELRQRAKSESQASELWAKGKSERNQAAGDEGASYGWSKPEETLPWKAADEIERAHALLREALRNIYWCASDPASKDLVKRIADYLPPVK